MDDYYNMTPIEFSKFIKGYRNRIRREYETARFISYFSIKPYLDKKDSNKSIDKIIPFEWEKEFKNKPIKKLTKEEVEELQTKFNFFN